MAFLTGVDLEGRVQERSSLLGWKLLGKLETKQFCLPQTDRNISVGFSTFPFLSEVAILLDMPAWMKLLKQDVVPKLVGAFKYFNPLQLL